MLKTTTGKASDLETALNAAVDTYNAVEGIKRIEHISFLIDGATGLYLVIVLYEVGMREDSDLPQSQKDWPQFIHVQGDMQDDTT